MNARRYNRICKRITFLESLLEKIENALVAAVEAGTGYVDSYSFSSGDGTQSTKYRRLEDVQRLYDETEAELERLYRKIDGTGLGNLNVRRKS